ncbi:MAG: cysteine--tRNA ligase [Zetaproteobacteria bacterium CG2_30_46_52]|nr:MAG: cysteine--tRNA ligase [Zetaproteobacteria bacterium CG2_30_46_52]
MSSLSLFNSLNRKKETFIPLVGKRVGMYVCGVTVYDKCHVGHARVMVVFDTIYRWLSFLGFDVTYVRNFTDVDDKIIQRAALAGMSTDELTSIMIDAFHQDMDALGCLRPNLEPRATTHMSDMIRMIETLITRDFAYVSETGDVLYAVRKFADYGLLSGKNIDDLESGSRVDVDQHKRDPLDFVLWKPAKEGEPFWDSPWGKGRPGWHIECSAMSCKHLGASFDIHGGGMDLKFPHHENEIAQARAANDGLFAKYWLHNGFVNINAEKMSKSLGNFFTISEVLEKYHPEVLRMFILGTHYRSPLDFSDAALDEAETSLNRLYETKRKLSQNFANGELPAAFVQAMNDDFNTADALSVMFEVCRDLNKSLDTGADVSALAESFTAMCDMLVLVQQDANAWFQGDADDASVIEALILQRTTAKSERDFALADSIRNELLAKGIVLEDTPDGTLWKKV